ncbi:MAG TPA: protein-glutamate O-methyltransferase CheR [Conexibacter sp.]|jgi:chemotaxis protein methyltransferase CheR
MTATAPQTTDDYSAFCEGVRALTRIDLLQYKRGQMERRIRTFAQRRGVTELPVYLAQLRGDRAELDEFLDRMTINVSQLWRNPEQWSVLEQHVLPELLADRGSVKAWSAGCSYGAEAYTLAALSRELHERERRIGSPRFEVLGTDIDRRMVDRATRGRFSDEDARTAPKRLLERWFERDGDGWQATRALRSLTRFEVGDLLRLHPRREAYDLVLCRNTVIYFTEDVRDQLHERLVASLRPGGYLVIGATERVSHPRELGLLATHPFTYRKS